MKYLEQVSKPLASTIKVESVGRVDHETEAVLSLSEARMFQLTITNVSISSAMTTHTTTYQNYFPYIMRRILYFEHCSNYIVRLSMSLKSWIDLLQLFWAHPASLVLDLAHFSGKPQIVSILYRCETCWSVRSSKDFTYMWQFLYGEVSTFCLRSDWFMTEVVRYDRVICAFHYLGVCCSHDQGRIDYA